MTTTPSRLRRTMVQALSLSLSLSLSLPSIKVVIAGAGLRLSERARTAENNFQSVVGELVRGADGLPLAAERTER